MLIMHDTLKKLYNKFVQLFTDVHGCQDRLNRVQEA